MIPGPHRRKGAGPIIGTGPGGAGPFGPCGADTTDMTDGEEWTGERAARYLSLLPAGARLLAVLASENGSVAVADLRTRLISVRGCRTAHGFALRRGVREGWWPTTIPEPVTPVYDPADPHRHRAVAYTMAPARRAVFLQALARLRGDADSGHPAC
ncbi:hypothetical protein [Streptomyces sp. GQFP]|uniref:hypothetical protein n=1 Tax=Streptomyces sp. GQFP TaxID=2907545 RepID=UPI001F43CF6B|nr:hypothetical protein [Streptomyces sp. GQFP]UIX34465.1 hypothetical protein LUX31_33155 [Streptomyces sp. GQFP]